MQIECVQVAITFLTPPNVPKSLSPMDYFVDSDGQWPEVITAPTSIQRYYVFLGRWGGIALRRTARLVNEDRGCLVRQLLEDYRQPSSIRKRPRYRRNERLHHFSVFEVAAELVQFTRSNSENAHGECLTAD